MTTRTWRGRVFIGVSLDGFIARRDGSLDWLTDQPNDRGHAPVTSSVRALEWDTFYPEIDHLVMGRGTYEKVLTFGDWPYPDKNVIVLSTTLTNSDQRIRLVRSLDEAVVALDADEAEQVYVDGGQVVQAGCGPGHRDHCRSGPSPDR